MVAGQRQAVQEDPVAQVLSVYNPNLGPLPWAPLILNPSILIVCHVQDEGPYLKPCSNKNQEGEGPKQGTLALNIGATRRPDQHPSTEAIPSSQQPSSARLAWPLHQSIELLPKSETPGLQRSQTTQCYKTLEPKVHSGCTLRAFGNFVLEM